MRYRIYYEPKYIFECKAILGNIMNGASIKDELGVILAKHGESLRSNIEPLFLKAMEIEKFFQESVCLNLAGYENTGADLAAFLFSKWNGAESVPFDAIYSYNLMAGAGMDSKAISILYVIGLEILTNVWSLQEIEAGGHPPAIDDNKFFEIVNTSPLTQDDKLKALGFYLGFDEYNAYYHALMQHAAGLLKCKTDEYADEIKVHMEFVKEHLLDNNAILPNGKASISENDNLLYHVYPSVYRGHVLHWHTASYFDPHVEVGINMFEIEKQINSAKSDKDKAADFLKCLSDGTKQSILKLLRNEPHYGSQLADKLNCTSANISQHMSALFKLDVVHMSKENNRIYYHINKDAIRKHFELAIETFA